MNNQVLYQSEKQNNNKNLQFHQQFPQPQKINNQQAFENNQVSFQQQNSFQPYINTQCKLKLIGNQFYQLKELGSGQEGIIYEGKNCSTGEIFAIKIYKEISDREIELLQQLKVTAFQNIVQIKDFLVQQNENILVMEQGKGGMDELMSQVEFNKMSIQEKNQLFHQMLKGVNQLYKMGYFHRDLKPQNFIYFKDSNKQITIKLIDFGQIKELGITNSLQRGTMSYMAPEIILASDDYQYDHKSDIWSLGIIWYEMITGTQFFQVKGEKQYLKTLKSLSQNVIDKIIDDNPQFQAFEKALMKKILVIDPNNRIELENIIEEINNKNQLLEKDSELQLLICKSEKKINQLKNIMSQINDNLPDYESYTKISSKKTDQQKQIKDQIQNLQNLLIKSEKDKELLLQELKANESSKGGQIRQVLITQLQNTQIQLQENDQELNSILKLVNNQNLKILFQEQKNLEIYFGNIKEINKKLENFKSRIYRIKQELNQTEIMQSIEMTKELIQQIESSLQINQQQNQFEKIKQDYKQNFDQYKLLFAQTNYILLYQLTRLLKRIKDDFSRKKCNCSQIQMKKRANDEQELINQYQEAQKLKDIYEIQLTQGFCELIPEEMEDHQKNVQMQIHEREEQIQQKNGIRLRPIIKNQQFVKFALEQFLKNKEFTIMSLFDQIPLQGRIHAQTEENIRFK